MGGALCMPGAWVRSNLKQQGVTGEPPRMTRSGSKPHWDACARINRTRTVHGTWEVEGFNTSWASGPANVLFLYIESKKKNAVNDRICLYDAGRSMIAGVMDLESGF